MHTVRRRITHLGAACALVLGLGVVTMTPALAKGNCPDHPHAPSVTIAADDD